MRHIKIKLIIVMMFALVFSSFVFAEPTEAWKGYGLYNLNDQNITVLREDISMEPLENMLSYKGEFLLKNEDNAYNKVLLGMPATGIEAIIVIDAGSSIKCKKRTLESIINEFNLENKIPHEDFWYVFNISLEPGQAKIIKIQFNTAMQVEQDGFYTISYLDDRNIGYNNKIDKSVISLKIPDFQPYNIVSLLGIKTSSVGKHGDITVNTAYNEIDSFNVKYFDVVKAALSRLQASAISKPKSIAKGFLACDYEKVISICDEYIKNPIDSQISKEQILFFKAESLRRLQNYDEYLNIVETLDNNKLYPAQLKNKIAYDRAQIYFEQKQKEKLQLLYEQLEQDGSKDTNLLFQWMNDNFMTDASKQSLLVDNKYTPKLDNASESKNKLIKLCNAFINYKYIPIIIFVVGFLTGLFIRRLRLKRRRRNPMYIYRM